MKNIKTYEDFLTESTVNDMVDLVKKGFGWATIDWVRESPINHNDKAALAVALAKDGLLFNDDDLKDEHIDGQVDPKQDGIKPMSVADAKKL